MNKKGFLLFEVVVSIVIITTALLFITRSYSSSKDSIRRSGEILRVSLLLEEAMWKFEDKGLIEAEKSSGDFKKPEGYAWEVEAKHLEEEGTTRPELDVVRLSVFKKKDRAKTTYSLWTYLRDKFL